jgi:hypothetical protein
MERAGLDLSRLLVAAGALGLLTSLFLPWVQVGAFDKSEPHIEVLLPSHRYTGWEAFEIADILLALIALGAVLGLGIALVLRARWPFLGVAGLGWTALALTQFGVYYAAHAPPIGGASRPGAGFLVALLASGAIAGGALWSGLARVPD